MYFMWHVANILKDNFVFLLIWHFVKKSHEDKNFWSNIENFKTLLLLTLKLVRRKFCQYFQFSNNTF